MDPSGLNSEDQKICQEPLDVPVILGTDSPADNANASSVIVVDEDKALSSPLDGNHAIENDGSQTRKPNEDKHVEEVAHKEPEDPLTRKETESKSEESVAVENTSMEHTVRCTVEIHYLFDRPPQVDPHAPVSRRPSSLSGIHKKAETGKGAAGKLAAKKGIHAVNAESKEPIKFFITWRLAEGYEGQTDILQADNSTWQTTVEVNANIVFLADVYEKPIEFKLFRVCKRAEPNQNNSAPRNPCGSAMNKHRGPATLIFNQGQPKSLPAVNESSADAATLAFRQRSIDALSKRVFSLAYTRNIPEKLKGDLARHFSQTQGGKVPGFLFGHAENEVDEGGSDSDYEDSMTRSDESLFSKHTPGTTSFRFAERKSRGDSRYAPGSLAGGRVTLWALRKAALAVARPRSGVQSKDKEISEDELDDPGSKSSKNGAPTHRRLARRNRPKTPPRPHHYEVDRPLSAPISERGEIDFVLFEESDSDVDGKTGRPRSGGAKSASSRPKTPPQPHHGGRERLASPRQIPAHADKEKDIKPRLLMRPKTPPQPHQSDRFEKTVKPVPVARNFIKKKALEDHNHVASVFINSSDLFLGDVVTGANLRQKVDGLSELQVTLHLDSPLLSAGQEEVFNPMSIEITKIRNMPEKPLSYAQLRRDCLPVYTRFSVLDKKFVSSKILPHNRDLLFRSRHVILTGMHDEDRLRSWLLREPLVIEVHDRDRKMDAGVGPAIAEVNPQNKSEIERKHSGIMPTESELANPSANTDHIGTATFSLTDLVTGEFELQLRSPVLPGPYKKPILGTSAPLPPALWLESDTYLQIKVRLHSPIIGFPAVATAAVAGDDMDVDANAGLGLALKANASSSLCIDGKKPDLQSVPLPCGVFSRAVVIIRRHGEEILSKIQQKIVEINASCLDIPGDHDKPETTHALSAYKLSPEQRAEREFDLISGIHIYDEDGGVYYLEGLCYSGMPTLVSEIERLTEIYPHKCRLLTSRATYAERSWMECNALPRHVRLFPLSLCNILSKVQSYFRSYARPNATWNGLAQSKTERFEEQNVLIPDTTSSQLLHSRDASNPRAVIGAGCFDIILMLSQLRNLHPITSTPHHENRRPVARNLQDVDRLHLFPTLESINTLKDRYGQESTLAEAVRTRRIRYSRKTMDEDPSKPKNKQNLLSWVRSGFSSAIRPDENLTDADLGDEEDLLNDNNWQSKFASGKVFGSEHDHGRAVDDRNWEFVDWLKKNKDHHPDFITQVKARYPGHVQPRERWYGPPPSDSQDTTGGAVYNYSIQKLNTIELQRRSIIKKIAADPQHRLYEFPGASKKDVYLAQIVTEGDGAGWRS